MVKEKKGMGGERVEINNKDFFFISRQEWEVVSHQSYILQQEMKERR